MVITIDPNRDFAVCACQEQIALMSFLMRLLPEEPVIKDEGS